VQQSSLKTEVKKSRSKLFRATLVILLLIVVIAILSITIYNRRATYPPVPPNVDSSGTNGVRPDSLHRWGL